MFICRDGRTSTVSAVTSTLPPTLLQSMSNTPTHPTVMNRAHDDKFSTIKYHIPLGSQARGLLERLPVDELNIMKGVI